MKIAFFSSKSYDQEYFKLVNKEYGYDLHFFEVSLKPSSAILASGFDAVCAFVNDKINRETLSILAENNIRLIALRCAGFNNVDLEAASELGIKILRVPAYSPHAVAEHAVALILTLNRKTHKAYNRVRDNNFSLERLSGFDVYGKKVGIIGTGNIGKEFGRIMNGFGCKLQAFDIHQNPDVLALGAEYVNLEKLFSTSDIISLHCPLTPSTYQIINKNSLAMMKKGAMLINTSRGKLINSADVLESLVNRHLGYLGIDVYSEEEKLFFKDLSEMIIDDEIISRLMSFPNVLITAHQAFLTHEALEEIAMTTLGNIKDFAQGNANNNEVSFEQFKAK